MAAQWPDLLVWATGRQIHMTPYIEFISGRAKPSSQWPFYQGRLPFYQSQWPFYQGQWPFYQASRTRDFRAGLGSRT